MQFGQETRMSSSDVPYMNKRKSLLDCVDLIFPTIIDIHLLESCDYLMEFKSS